MARVLKRHNSTIFREVKRNFWADDVFPKKYAGYFGHAAQLQTDKRRSVQRKLIRHPELYKAVIARIKQGWTPEQIGNRMIFEGAKLRVCQETICPKSIPRNAWHRSSGGTCPSIAQPAGSVVPESARHRSSTVMSASCSDQTMSHTVVSSGTGKVMQAMGKAPYPYKKWESQFRYRSQLSLAVEQTRGSDPSAK